MQSILTFSDFQAHLNDVFWVRLADQQKYELMLAGVTDLGEKHGGGYPRAFSVLFQNPRRDVYLSQRIYRLEHETLGALDIFLVPLGPNEDGMAYEAIFA